MSIDGTAGQLSQKWRHLWIFPKEMAKPWVRDWHLQWLLKSSEHHSILGGSFPFSVAHSVFNDTLFFEFAGILQSSDNRLKKIPLTETNQCVWLLSLLLNENRSFYPSIQVCDRVEECNLVYNLQFFVMLPNTVVSHIIIHHRCSGHVFFHNNPQFMPVDHHRLPRVETSIWTSTASARIFCRTDFSFYESLHQLSIISNRFLVH